MEKNLEKLLYQNGNYNNRNFFPFQRPKNIEKYSIVGKTDHTGAVTIVTAFFDLNKKEKRSPNRSLEEYLKKGEVLMKQNYPIVFFCEEDTYKLFKKQREKFVDNDMTIFIVMDLEKIPMSGFRKNMTDNFKKMKPVGYTEDKDTPLFMLLTLSKFGFVKKAINENFFNSDYFMWIDYGIGHVSKKIHPDSISPNIFIKNKVKVMEIMLVTDEEIKNKKDYFRCIYRGKMAGGLWGGDIEVLKKFIKIAETTTSILVEEGYAFLEEALLTYLYKVVCPKLFERNYGDYDCLLENINNINCYHKTMWLFYNRCLEHNDLEEQYHYLQKIFTDKNLKVLITKIPKDHLEKYLKRYIYLSLKKNNMNIDVQDLKKIIK